MLGKESKAFAATAARQTEAMEEMGEGGGIVFRAGFCLTHLLPASQKNHTVMESPDGPTNPVNKGEMVV